MYALKITIKTLSIFGEIKIKTFMSTALEIRNNNSYLCKGKDVNLNYALHQQQHQSESQYSLAGALGLWVKQALFLFHKNTKEKEESFMQCCGFADMGWLEESTEAAQQPLLQNRRRLYFVFSNCAAELALCNIGSAARMGLILTRLNASSSGAGCLL